MEINKSMEKETAEPKSIKIWSLIHFYERKAAGVIDCKRNS